MGTDGMRPFGKCHRLCALLRDRGPLTFPALWENIQKEGAEFFSSRSHTRGLLRALIRHGRVRVFLDREYMASTNQLQQHSFRYMLINEHKYGKDFPPQFNAPEPAK